MSSRSAKNILLEGGIHMSNISIRELADRTREAQQAMGLSQHTVWEHHMTALLPIVKLHEGPFLSGYTEALANGQMVTSNTNIVFDTDSVDSVGNNIVLDPTGRIFTVNHTGLYHIEWTVNLAPESAAPAVVGIIENNEGASGAANSERGNFSSGTLINL